MCRGKKGSFFKRSEWKNECKEEGKEKRKTKGKQGKWKESVTGGASPEMVTCLVLAIEEVRKGISALGKHHSKVHTLPPPTFRS